MAVVGGERGTACVHDLPEPVLSQVLALVTDVRSRNAVALVCRKWRSLERLTRTSLSLRGDVRNPLLLPTCFPSISHLDLSLLSPWGHHTFPYLPAPTRLDGYPHRDNYNDYRHHYLLAAVQQLLVAQQFGQRFGEAFPNVTSLTVYAPYMPAILPSPRSSRRSGRDSATPSLSGGTSVPTTRWALTSPRSSPPAPRSPPSTSPTSTAGPRTSPRPSRPAPPPPPPSPA